MACKQFASDFPVWTVQRARAPRAEATVLQSGKPVQDSAATAKVAEPGQQIVTLKGGCKFDVIPAKAGIHRRSNTLDPRFRGDDGNG
jgi:hypothetical protein